MWHFVLYDIYYVSVKSVANVQLKFASDTDMAQMFSTLCELIAWFVQLDFFWCTTKFQVSMTGWIGLDSAGIRINLIEVQLMYVIWNNKLKLLQIKCHKFPNHVS